MSFQLRQSHHALASISLLMILVIVIYFSLAKPLQQKNVQLESDLETASFQLTKFKHIAKQRTPLINNLKLLKKSFDTNEDFIHNQSQSLASADLQKSIKELIKKNGANLVSIQNINTQLSEDFETVGLKINLTGNTDSIKTILYELTINKPVLILDNLVIQSRTQSASTRRASSSRADPIELRLDVYAYLLDQPRNESL